MIFDRYLISGYKCIFRNGRTLIYFKPFQRPFGKRVVLLDKYFSCSQGCFFGNNILLSFYLGICKALGAVKLFRIDLPSKLLPTVALYSYIPSAWFGACFFCLGIKNSSLTFSGGYGKIYLLWVCILHILLPVRCSSAGRGFFILVMIYAANIHRQHRGYYCYPNNHLKNLSCL